MKAVDYTLGILQWIAFSKDVFFDHVVFTCVWAVTSSCSCVLRATLESSPPIGPCWACVGPKLWKPRHPSVRSHAEKHILYQDTGRKVTFILWIRWHKPVLPLREQLFTGQIAWGVHFLVVVSILGLHGVGGQEHCCLWRAVDVVI